jgi:hypothetical protein
MGREMRRRSFRVCSPRRGSKHRSKQTMRAAPIRSCCQAGRRCSSTKAMPRRPRSSSLPAPTRPDRRNLLLFGDQRPGVTSVPRRALPRALPTRQATRPDGGPEGAWIPDPFVLPANQALGHRSWSRCPKERDRRGLHSFSPLIGTFSGTVGGTKGFRDVDHGAPPETELEWRGATPLHPLGSPRRACEKAEHQLDGAKAPSTCSAARDGTRKVCARSALARPARKPARRSLRSGPRGPGCSHSSSRSA